MVLCFIGPLLQASDLPRNLRIPDSMGVNIHFVDAQPGEMDLLAEAGFRWIRMDFTWADIEKSKGHFEFAAYDRLVKNCEDRNIRVLALLAYTNPLYDQNLSPHTDEGIAGFTAWTVALVNHFQGKGILWEMYNEPNGGFWKPQSDVNAYIKLALAVGKAIKSAAPRELYCGPALSGTDGGWLEPCYKAGLLNYWDAVTVHPYGDEPPEGRAPHYRGSFALLERYCPAGKTVPLLSGEWGYTVTRVNPETQGKYFARQMLFNLLSGIPLSIWYDWRDDGPDPKDGEQNFGLVRNAYHPGANPVLETKPAYLAAKTLATELQGFTFNSRVTSTNPADFILTFRKGTDIRWAAWSTSTTAHLAKLTVPRDVFEVLVTATTGQRLAKAPVEHSEIQIEINDGPKYLTPIASRKQPGSAR
jgi:hypothetical protein